MKPALHFPRIGKILLAAALVATFGIASLPAEAKPKPKQASAAAGKPIQGEINASKALTFLYGNAKAKSANTPPTGSTYYANIRSIQPGKDWDKLNIETFAGKRGKAYVVHTERYTEQGKEKYMVIAEVEALDKKGESACNFFACSPLMHGAVFAKEGEQWVLEAKSDSLDNILGAYGSLGRTVFRLIKVGRDKYGLLQDSEAGGRGDCAGSYFSVTMPHGGRLESFRIDYMEICDREGYEPEAVEKCKGRKQKPTGVKESLDGGVVIAKINEGDPEDEYATVGDWDGKLMTVDAGAEYYDIVAQSKHREKVCAPITWQTRRFRFENGEYKEVGAK